MKELKFDHAKLAAFSGVYVGYGVRTDTDRLKGVSIAFAASFGEEETVAKAMNAVIAKRATPEKLAQLCQEVAADWSPGLRDSLPGELFEWPHSNRDIRTAVFRALLSTEEFDALLAPSGPTKDPHNRW